MSVPTGEQLASTSANGPHVRRGDRVRFSDFAFTRTPSGQCTAEVELEYDGQKVAGRSSGQSSPLADLRVAAEAAFARVTRMVFVDRLVPIDFVDGQIRPEGELDLHALSDHGAVLSELEKGALAQIDRRTVLLVLGDARNNRRPARADALRRIALRARAVVWAVPEPRARWYTGDSALAAYAPSCDLVVEATSLAGLLAALRESAR